MVARAWRWMHNPLILRWSAQVLSTSELARYRLEWRNRSGLTPAVGRSEGHARMTVVKVGLGWKTPWKFCRDHAKRVSLGQASAVAIITARESPTTARCVLTLPSGGSAGGQHVGR